MKNSLLSIWVLIIISTMGYKSISVHSITFDSKTKCKAAQQSLSSNDPDHRLDMVCTKKSQ